VLTIISILAMWLRPFRFEPEVPPYLAEDLGD